MCWTPELIEFPCEWKHNGQDAFEDLGIELSTYKGTVFLDVKSIVRINKGDEDNQTTIEISGTIWTVFVPIGQVLEVVKRCGVSIKNYKEILSQPVKS